MKKILINTQETRQYLRTLQKIYVVVRYEKYEIIEFPFTGLYKNDELLRIKRVPLVYDYNDSLDIKGAYYLRLVTHTTSKSVLFWSLDRGEAYKVMEKANKKFVNLN